MKHLIFGIAILFALACAAQDRVIARATIPFGFSVHGQSFEAGSYDLCQIGANIIRFVRTKSGNGLTLLSPQTIAAPLSVKLLFRQSGDRYFLAGVHAANFQIPLRPSAAERQYGALPVKTVEIATTH